MTNPAPECDHRSTEKGWRDIASAPKDGTKFIAWPAMLEGGIIAAVTAWWYSHPSTQGWITDAFDCGDYEFSPTHWTPSPGQPPAHQENSPRSAGDASTEKGDMTDQAPELLPCPCCKQRAELHAFAAGEVVVCVGCGLETAMCDDAAARWNVRPTAERPAPQVREALANRLGKVAGRTSLERDREIIIEACNALRALTPVVAREPVGWPPREPTEEMLVAAREWSRGKYGKPIGNDAAKGCWQTMLDASPPPASAVREALEKIANAPAMFPWARDLARKTLSIKGTADESTKSIG